MSDYSVPAKAVPMGTFTRELAVTVDRSDQSTPDKRAEAV